MLTLRHLYHEGNSDHITYEFTKEKLRHQGPLKLRWKCPQCPFRVLHSHSDIHVFCILVESCPALSSTVIPKDFLSKCVLPIAMKHTKPGDTLGSRTLSTQERAWLRHPRVLKVSPPRKISHTGERFLATYWIVSEQNEPKCTGVGEGHLYNTL